MAATQLVNDMKLTAEHHSDGSPHYTSQLSYALGQACGDLPMKQIWTKEKSFRQGPHGKVWLERCSTGDGSARLRVVKMINKPRNPNWGEALGAFAISSLREYREVFVEFLGWYEDSESIYIMTEHVELGDLSQCLSAPLPEDEARRISLQILQGLKLLHNNQLMHQNLKLENVFVMSAGPEWRIKIGDFGFSTQYAENSSWRTQIGTQLFVAPEIQRIYPPGLDQAAMESKQTHTVDIWSLGVMIFYMLCHAYPFPDRSSLYSYVCISGFHPSNSFHRFTPEAQGFLKLLLAVNPTMRLSAEEALGDYWMQCNSTTVSSRAPRLPITQKGETPEASSSMTGKTASLSDQVSFEVSDDFGTTARPSAQTTITKLVSPVALPASKQPSLSFQTEKLLQSTHDGRHSFFNNRIPGRTPEEAELAFWTAFKECTKALGPNHPHTLRSLHWLGEACFKQGEFSKAARKFQQAHSGYVKILGRNHADTLEVLDRLGKALAKQGDYTHAREIYQQAYDGHKEVKGENHPFTIGLLLAIGNTLVDQGDFVMAAKTFRQAFRGYKEIERKSDGFNQENDQMLRWSLASMGEALYELEKLVKADNPSIKLHPKEYQNLYGTDNLDVAWSFFAWGETLLKQGDFAEAADKFQYACERQRRINGAKPEDTLRFVYSFGEALYHQGEFAKAGPVLQQAHNGYKELHGAIDPITLRCLCWLGNCHLEMKEYAMAMQKFEQLYQGCKETFGVKHVETLRPIFFQGKALLHQGEFAKASEKFRLAYDGFKEDWGEKDQDALRSLSALGMCLYYQGAYMEAHQKLQRAYEGYIIVFGADNPDTIELQSILEDDLLSENHSKAAN